MNPCRNGGCERLATVLIRIGMRTTDERGVCSECAAALVQLYPDQRPIPGIAAWARRAADHELPTFVVGGIAA